MTRLVTAGDTAFRPAESAPEVAAALSDAALISWCLRWAETEAEYAEVTRPYARSQNDTHPPEVVAATTALWSEGCDLLERIKETPATTMPGRQAKARVVLRIRLDTGGRKIADEIADGILRDVLMGDPCLAAMDRVAAARGELATECQRSKPGDPAYELLNDAARSAEADMAQVWRVQA